MKQLEEVIRITEEHKKIKLDFRFSKNDVRNSTIRLFQWRRVIMFLDDSSWK